MTDTSLIAELDRRAEQRLAGPLGETLAAVAGDHAPRLAIVSCADARLVPEALFGLSPNEALVVRSAGNLASPGGGQFASLLLAIQVCGVADLIVLGHSDCAAMRCLRDPAFRRDQAELVEHLLGCDPELDEALVHADSVEAAAKINVRRQLRIIGDALASRGLTGVRVHGRYLDMARARLEALR